MKVAIFLLAVVSCALASVPVPLKQHPGPGEAVTNKILGLAQHKVNKIALAYGAGVGTAPIYGVPGTGVKGYAAYGKSFF